MIPGFIRFETIGQNAPAEDGEYVLRVADILGLTRSGDECFVRLGTEYNYEPLRISTSSYLRLADELTGRGDA